MWCARVCVCVCARECGEGGRYRTLSLYSIVPYVADFMDEPKRARLLSGFAWRIKNSTTAQIRPEHVSFLASPYAHILCLHCHVEISHDEIKSALHANNTLLQYSFLSPKHAAEQIPRKISCSLFMGTSSDSKKVGSALHITEQF